MKLLLGILLLAVLFCNVGCCCFCGSWFSTWKDEWNCGDDRYHDTYTEAPVDGSTTTVEVSSAGS